MGKVKVDKERCKGCLLCVEVCPKGLLIQAKTLNRRGVKFVEHKEADSQGCTGCALCAVICPDCCIEVYR